jgi:glycosyltransferase involved in cell wall biosynthesis
MKILYVITRAECGGAQVHLTDLLASLPREFEAVVATGEREGFLVDRAKSLGVPVRIIPHLTQPIHPVKDILALRELKQTIKDESPDLVHAHTSKAGLLARVAAAVTRTPVVFTAHTWSFADGISARRQRWAVPLERFAAGLGKKIIAVSQANKEMALRRSVGTADSIVKIWNGIPDVPHRAQPGSGDPRTLIMTARFVAQKDHLLLVEALSQLEGDWRLLLVGDGIRRPEIQRAIAKAGLSDRIECLGERSDIPELLASADLFVLATHWEGLPLCIIEAMRAGLPVVATDVGGDSEVVTDGVTGYLTPSGDAGQLRDRIRELLASPSRLAAMGRSGRRRYEQEFTLGRMACATWSVYREAVGVPEQKELVSPLMHRRSEK